MRMKKYGHSLHSMKNQTLEEKKEKKITCDWYDELLVASTTAVQENKTSNTIIFLKVEYR